MNRQEAVRRATELVEQMSVEELASQLRFDADEIPHLDIPEYNWWNEGLHGVARAGTATVFPQAIGLGATFDEELLERIGVAVSTEARAKYNENEKHEDMAERAAGGYDAAGDDGNRDGGRRSDRIDYRGEPGTGRDGDDLSGHRD